MTGPKQETNALNKLVVCPTQLRHAFFHLHRHGIVILTV